MAAPTEVGRVSSAWLERAVVEAATADVKAGVDDSDSSDDGVFVKNLRGRGGAAPDAAEPVAATAAGFEVATEADFHELLGATVSLVGLVSEPELNGATGRVMSWHASTGRAGVRVGDRMLALKPTNLLAVPPSPPASPPDARASSTRSAPTAEKAPPLTAFRTRFTTDTEPGFAERHQMPARLHLEPSGITVTLEQTSGEECADEWMQSSVWVAAAVLAEAMQLPSGIFPGGPAFWRGKRVLELGAGCGACGIVAARCGARRVVLTDYEPLLALLRRNAAANGVAGCCEAVGVEWEAATPDPLLEPDSFDVILGSDVTAFIQSLPHLAATLRRLLTASPSAIACISHTVRGDDLRWVLEAFSPYFECRDVTSAGADESATAAKASRPAPLAAGCGAATGEERLVADTASVALRDTRILILSLRPASAGREDAGDGGGGADAAGPDSAERAAMAKFEAARARLGLKLP